MSVGRLRAGRIKQCVGLYGCGRCVGRGGGWRDYVCFGANVVAFFGIRFDIVDMCSTLKWTKYWYLPVQICNFSLS